MATTRRVKTWDDVMRTVDQYTQKKVASMSDKARKSVRDGALNEEADAGAQARLQEATQRRRVRADIIRA